MSRLWLGYALGWLLIVVREREPLQLGGQLAALAGLLVLLCDGKTSIE